MIGTRRGFCHRNRLPVRGQRTHTNARTARKTHLSFARKTSIRTVASTAKTIKKSVVKSKKK